MLSEKFTNPGYLHLQTFAHIVKYTDIILIGQKPWSKVSISVYMQVDNTVPR